MAEENVTAEVGGVAVDRLRSLIERIERLEEEKKGIQSDIRDIFAEAKSAGFDVKAMRTTKDEDSYKHLENRDFEALQMYVMNLLMGIE